MRPVGERQWHPFAGAMRFVDRQDHLQRPPRPVAAAQRLAVLDHRSEQVGDNQIVQRMLLWALSGAPGGAGTGGHAIFSHPVPSAASTTGPAYGRGWR